MAMSVHTNTTTYVERRERLHTRTQLAVSRLLFETFLLYSFLFIRAALNRLTGRWVLTDS